MKPKHQRLVFITVSVVFLCLSVVITLRAFRDNLVFFYSPSDLVSHTISPTQLIRVGGLVEAGTIVRNNNDDSMTFIITDGNAKVSVHYKGLVPNLFRDGQGIVAEGTLANNQLEAKSILAKHDEKYMPREVVDALKRSGRWKGDQNNGR